MLFPPCTGLSLPMDNAVATLSTTGGDRWAAWAGFRASPRASLPVVGSGSGAVDVVNLIRPSEVYVGLQRSAVERGAFVPNCRDSEIEIAIYNL